MNTVAEADSVLALVRELVAINSANPDTDPSGAGEGAIASFCTDWCRGHSLVVTDSAEPAGRPSLVAESVESTPGATVLLVGHLDTYSWWHPGPGVSNCLRGPGVGDMKAGIATILVLLDRFRRTGHPGRLRGVFTSDEEHTSRGLRALLPSLHGSDVAIVLESTGLQLGIGHAGRVLVVARLREALDRQRLATSLHHWSRITHVRVSVGMRPGGVEFRAEVPSEARARMVAGQLTAIIGQFAEIDYVHVRDAFDGRAAKASGLIETFTAAAETRGLELRPVTLAGWTEAAMLEAAGIPTVIFGPEAHGAHSRDEWVDPRQVVVSLEVVAAALPALLVGHVRAEMQTTDPSFDRPPPRGVQR